MDAGAKSRDACRDVWRCCKRSRGRRPRATSRYATPCSQLHARSADHDDTPSQLHAELSNAHALLYTVTVRLRNIMMHAPTVPARCRQPIGKGVRTRARSDPRWAQTRQVAPEPCASAETAAAPWSAVSRPREWPAARCSATATTASCPLLRARADSHVPRRVRPTRTLRSTVNRGCPAGCSGRRDVAR